MKSVIALVLLASVAAVAVQAQTPGTPVVVQPTPNFNPNPTGVYSVADRNPNPDTQVEWNIMYPPPTASVIAIGMGLVPGSQNAFLFVGRHAGGQATYFDFKEYLTAVLELEAPGGPKITNVTVKTDVFCSHLLPTSDGRMLIISGSEENANGFADGLKIIRLYDYKNNKLNIEDVATMQCGRWYPTGTIMPDKTIMISGGTQTASEFGPNCSVIERWNPEEPTLSPPVSYPVEPNFLRRSNRNFFPIVFVLPTGHLWMQQDNQLKLVDYNGTFLDIGGIPKWPVEWKIQWPRSASVVMGPLTYEDDYSSVDIIIFGGQLRNATCQYGTPDNKVVASREVRRMKIQWTFDENGEPMYTWNTTDPGIWDTEDMGIPRQGGDATLLPNGDIHLTSGSQQGCHGASRAGMTRHSNPALWPILYQPDRPAGQRVTVLEATPISRVYHMSAALTLDGHVLVGGCDACMPTTNYTIEVDALVRDTWFSPSITGRREFRTEAFVSPYALDAANRPKFVSINGVTDATAVINATYGDEITVVWESDQPDSDFPLVPLTKASLVAPSAATHGWNTNQRVVFVPLVDYEAPDGTSTQGTVKIRMPPSARVAPPQMYLLFLLNSKTHGRARWIHLQ